jgi:NAD-dependent dihydropyrimidine dehydrogenase PreA subunit
MNIIKVDETTCGGCKNCYKSCWVDVIRWNEEKKQPVIAYPRTAWIVTTARSSALLAASR